MGFLKDLGLLKHAHSIAANFAELRKAHYDFTIRNIAQVAWRSIPIERQALGGEADLALKGFQLFYLVSALKVFSYIPDSYDAQVFCGYVIKAGWEAERESVDRFCLRISQCGGDLAKQAAQVAVPFQRYVLSDIDPAVQGVIGTLFPAFAIGTQLTIANEFGDKSMVSRLREGLRDFRENLSLMN